MCHDCMSSAGGRTSRCKTAFTCFSSTTLSKSPSKRELTCFGRTHQPLSLLEEPCTFCVRGQGQRWCPPRGSPQEGHLGVLWQLRRLQERVQHHHCGHPGLRMGLGRTSRLGICTFIELTTRPQGVNPSNGRLEIVTTANQDPLLTHVPVIGVDIWEHAFYLQYLNVKVDVRLLPIPPTPLSILTIYFSRSTSTPSGTSLTSRRPRSATLRSSAAPSSELRLVILP